MFDVRRRMAMVSGIGVEPTLSPVMIGTIDLPEDVAVWDPGLLALSDGRPSQKSRIPLPAACVPGPYDVLAYQRSRLELIAVVVRRPAVKVTRWQSLGIGMDGHLVIAPAAFAGVIEFPGRPEGLPADARAWIHLARLADARPFVWIEDPAGVPAMRGWVGLDASALVAAIVIEMV